MGLFNKKWVVTFEYSERICSSKKKGSIVVDASNVSSAKAEAKRVLKKDYQYADILSIIEIDSKGRPVIKQISETGPQSKPSYNQNPKPVRELTPEELERQKRRIREEAAERERKQIERTIASKQKQIQKAKSAPVRNVAITGIVSAFAFLISWIPHWIFLAMKNNDESVLAAWIEMGHSESDSMGQELIAQTAKYGVQARNTYWIPFAVLGLCFVIAVLVYIISKKKVPQKVEKLEEELRRL